MGELEEVMAVRLLDRVGSQGYCWAEVTLALPLGFLRIQICRALFLFVYLPHHSEEAIAQKALGHSSI